MVSTLLILAVVACALAMVWVLVVRNGQQATLTLADWNQKKWEIDAQVFRSLVDCSQHEYLVRSLSPREFTSYERRRIRLALRMLRSANENAEMLVRLGTTARATKNPTLAREADQLVVAATQFRVNLALARACLWAKWVFPHWLISLPPIEARYRNMVNSLLRVQQHA